MPRDYQKERDAIITRWYGGNPQTRNPRPGRNWSEGPIAPETFLNPPTACRHYCLRDIFPEQLPGTFTLAGHPRSGGPWTKATGAHPRRTGQR